MPAFQTKSLSPLFHPSQLVVDRAGLKAYEQDAGLECGHPQAVVLPVNAQDVQRIVIWAIENQTPLVGRGSGTGFTGGAVAMLGGVIVAFSRMAAILEIDQDSRQALVQPGVINQDLLRRLAPLNLVYPPDPASMSVCTLGGNIAENAGGPHCLKYGLTSNYILGLQVVLADGQLIWLGGEALDYPEYDFASLVTGSEGTLALVTQAVLGLRRPPQAVQALTACFTTVELAGQAVSAVIAGGLLPATIEMMDGSMVRIVEEYLHAGFPTQAGAMLIMDVDGYPQSLEAQLAKITTILQRFNPIEIKVAHTAEEREVLWKGRRSAAAAIARITPTDYGLDVSVPRSRLAEALSQINAISARHGFPVTYLAHAGDGNLHPSLLFDLSQPGEMERILQASKEILALCARLGGSIGAEHGIGFEKREELAMMYGTAELGAMLEVKQVFDPQRLLNPGKIFPEQIELAGEWKSPLEHEASLLKPVGEGRLGGVVGAVSTADLAAPQDEGDSVGAVSTTKSLTPQTAIEAAQALRELQAAQQPVYITGGGTKWRHNPPAGVVLSTTGLTGILELSVADLYVIVQSGTPVQELQAELAAAGFWLPLANPWWQATVGGLLSANINAPLRLSYGAVRDQLLALQVALPDGRLLRFGRPLVKDVAGYNMSKIFVGAYGSLGLLTELTLRLAPLPLSRRSLQVPVNDLVQGIAWGKAILQQAVISSGVVLAPQPAEREARYALIYTAEGHPADVRAELAIIRRVLLDSGASSIEETDAISATGEWERFLAQSPVDSRQSFLARVGVPPSSLTELLPLPSPFREEKEEGGMREVVFLDLAHGMLYVHAHGADEFQAQQLLAGLRSIAEPLGGYALMMASPRHWLSSSIAWGEKRPAADLMRRLKLRWDPAGILNRGEFANLH